MPEFIMEGIDSPAFSALGEFEQGYIQALFFTSEQDCPNQCERCDCGECSGVPAHCGFDDLSPGALESILADCRRFRELAGDDLLSRAVETSPSGRDLESLGMDFWYTRNGHGVGFWECGPHSYHRWQEGPGTVLDAIAKCHFRECDVYLGDDDKVHVT